MYRGGLDRFEKAQVGVVMGYKLYTANFKDRIGLGSGSILIHF
jgi:hypothetical protein